MAYKPIYHAVVIFTREDGRLAMCQTMNYVNRADAEKEAQELEGVLMQIGFTDIKTYIREIRC